MNDSLSGTPKCPPGLGYLTQVDHLMVKERVRFLASNDTFTVKNSSGQNVSYFSRFFHGIPKNAYFLNV